MQIMVTLVKSMRLRKIGWACGWDERKRIHCFGRTTTGKGYLEKRYEKESKGEGKIKCDIVRRSYREKRWWKRPRIFSSSNGFANILLLSLS
jgi:hypothetical protein